MGLVSLKKKKVWCRAVVWESRNLETNGLFFRVMIGVRPLWINVRPFLIHVHPPLICVRLSKHVISRYRLDDHIGHFLVFGIYILK